MLSSVLVCAVTLYAAGVDPPESVPIEQTLIGVLRDELTERPDGRHVRALMALRELHDPTLRPLFAHLATSGSPDLRAQGILALAEIEPGSRIDLLLVRRLSEPIEQVALLRVALEEGRLDAGQIEDVVGWAGVDPGLQLVLLTELSRQGVEVDDEHFRELALCDRPAVAAAATLHLLHEPGAEPGEAPEQTAPHIPTPSPPPVLKRLMDLPPAQRDRELRAVLTHVRRYRLREAADFVADALEQPEPPEGTEGEVSEVWFEAMRTLLTIDPVHARAKPIWLAMLGKGAGVERRLRLALLALDVAIDRAGCEAAIPAWVAEPFAADEHRIISAIGRACEAVGKADPGPIADLVALGYAPATSRALRYASAAPDEAAIVVLTTVITTAMACPDRTGSAWTTQRPMAVRAARDLADLSPEDLLAILDRAIAGDDEPMVGVLMSGILRSANPAIAPEVACRSLPGRVAPALATLLVARSAERVTPEQLAVLDGIAIGVGGLADRYRVQAAWLALRHRGLAITAFSRLLPENN